MRNVTDVRSFMRLTGYYMRLIEGYSIGRMTWTRNSKWYSVNLRQELAMDEGQTSSRKTHDQTDF